MNEFPIANLATPKVEMGRAMLLAGLGKRYTFETSKDIPALWLKFQTHSGKIPKQVRAKGVTYGVCYAMSKDGFDYLAGVEVSDVSGLSQMFAKLSIPAQRYLVFTHREHISTMKSVTMTIWKDFLPKSEFKPAEAPYFERYGEDFDGRTGNGGFQIWIPIKG